MPACVLCGENTFDEFDGNFFCNNCGTQTQDLREEANVEPDTGNAGIGHSQQREIVAKKNKLKRRSKYAETDFGKPWLTYEALQCLLKAQIKALMDLGVNPALKDIVGQIWFHFLHKRKVAFTGAPEGSQIAVDAMRWERDKNLGLVATSSKSTKPKENSNDMDLKNLLPQQDVIEEDNELNDYDDAHSSDSVDEYSNSDSDDSDMEESVDIQQGNIGSKHYKNDSINNWTLLQHRHTVIFIYMGLLYLREPITIADIIRLIARGHLPYYKLSKVLPDHMKFSRDDKTLFTHRQLRPKTMHEGTNFLMNYLDLPIIPPPDIFLLIAKLILDFQLPAAIHRLTVSLVKACGYKPRTNFSYRRRVNCNEHYEEMVTAFIVVALKLVYGLDGETERNGNLLKKYLDVPVDDVDCWDCIMLRLEKKKQTDVRRIYPRCENDLTYITNCTNYAMYCAEEVLRGSDNLASRQCMHDAHSTFKACMSGAKEEYYGIMNEAVRELESGRPEQFRKLSSSSFVYDCISQAAGTDISCKCQKRNKLGSKTQALSDHNKDSYLIYLNDLSGLKVHDSYRFVLDVFSRRIEIKSVELHEFITYVETMLFVDPSL